MTYPGKGSASDVLQADSQSLLRYQAIGAPVTVASGTSLGATHTTVAAALAAGATVMAIIGDTFETVPLSTSDAVIITLQNNALWDLSDNDFSGTQTVIINGNGRLRYRKMSLGAEVFSTPLSLNGLSVHDDSTTFAPLVDDAMNSKISDCTFEGNVVLAGSGTLLSASKIKGNLIVMDTASGCSIQHVNMDGFVVDSGNNTILSNIKFN